MSDVRVKNFEKINPEQLDALLNISRLLNAEYQDNLIIRVLDLAIEVLNAERGLFARLTAENDFAIIAARHVKKEDISDLSQFSSGLLNQVLESKKPSLFHDIAEDPTVSQFTSVQNLQIKSVIGVPILLNDKMWGVLLVDSRGDRTYFTEDNLIFLEFFANLVSLSLDKILQNEALRDENRVLKNQIEAARSIPDMVGASSAMQKTADLIHRVAQTDASVLLLGESGTGKDLAARAIHQLGARKNKPFLAQFCGSIPDTLLESELFGYKKGAFSGATSDKKGLFEVASGGTFFLDEIGDISAATQAKLLRVLQNQEIIRLGDTQVRKVDCRIITASNKDLRQLVKDGLFRQDLFYRLNVFPITLPPLRERKSDIPLLTEFFIKKQNRDLNITSAVIRKLVAYQWPGNVRELENVLSRAFILCDSSTLKPEHIMLEDAGESASLNGTLKDIERTMLLSRLKSLNNNRTKTAESLGVSVRWVQLKLKEIEQQSN